MPKRRDDNASVPAPSSAPVLPDLVTALADESLISAAGAKVFERGLAIARSGAVNVQADADAPSVPSLRAQVQGTELYDVAMAFHDPELRSGCTCPHAADGWFCKHQVAVALTWRGLLTGQAPALDPAAQKQQAALAKRAKTQADSAVALRAFVQGQPAEALAERLLRWAEDVPELRRDLRAWMQMARAQSDPTAMKRAVTEILKPAGFLDWRGATAYAHQAERVLALLDQTLGTDPAAALKLAEQAYVRLQTVLAHEADDSNGEIGAVCEAVGQRWLQAVSASGPQPAAFGDRYLALRTDEAFDALGHARAVAAMGPAAAARYGQRVKDAWEAALAAREARRAQEAAEAASKRAARHPRVAALREQEQAHRRDYGKVSVWSTQLHYEEHLRVVDDGDEMLRVLRSDLSEPYACLKLTEELARQGRQREALEAARAGLQRFPDDDRLQLAVLAGYERDGWDEEALALRQRRFEQRPSVESFAAVLAQAPRAGVDPAPLREAMWAALAALEQQHLARIRATPWGRGADGPDVSLRLSILMAERRLDEALTLIQLPHRASADLLERLAASLPTARQPEAAGLLQRAFAFKMTNAKSPYTEVLALVKRIVERLAKPERAQWLAQLRAEHRAKRNFIQGLPPS